MDGELVYLVQTDTTVGFLSQSSTNLSNIKNRSASKHYITSLASLAELKSNTRVFRKHRKLVRSSKKKSFVSSQNNFSFRVIPQPHQHNIFVAKFGWIFSTSANPAGGGYSEGFAKSNCDVIVEDRNGLKELSSSKIIKLGKKKILKLR